MAERLKAVWEVYGGVLPGTPDTNWTKKWYYTSSDYDEDRTAHSPEGTIFQKRMNEVHEYARAISHPVYVNWVKVEFFWV